MVAFTGTRNFSLAADPKLACGCGCGLLPDQDFMERVQRARDRTNFPWPVTSGARCAAYNAKVSGTGETGPHTTSRAIDIGVQGVQAFAVVVAMLAEGFTGIGVNQKGDKRFIHGDDVPPGSSNLPRPQIWSY